MLLFFVIIPSGSKSFYKFYSYHSNVVRLIRKDQLARLLDEDV
jgi:hypothetical protein